MVARRTFCFWAARRRSSATSSSSALRRITPSTSRRRLAWTSPSFSAASASPLALRAFISSAYSGPMTSCAVPRLSALSLAFCMAASAFCLARTAASSAVLAALRAKLLAEANMPDMEVLAFSAGNSLTAASWPPRLAKAAAVSPCAFLRAGLAPAPSSDSTSSALPILAATISDVVLSSPGQVRAGSGGRRAGSARG